ncbi:MAG: lipocalin family protein [Bacillota bacterium]|nr:lipocalin family protein [Bacillota bacterium]
MRRIKKISLVAAIVFVMAVFLGGCGSSAPLAGDAAVGDWTMTSAEYAGITLSADDLKDAMGAMPVITINEDGSATVNFDGEESKGEVTKNDDGTYTLSDDTDETLNFEVKDKKLKLDYSAMDMLMVFEQK